MLSGLIGVLSAMSKSGPVILVAEDLHWVDPTTLELLVRQVEQIREEPVLCLFTFRPEFSSPWGNEPHTTTLALNHLTPHEVKRLVSTIVEELPGDLLEQVVSRTDGVPLYAEELSRAIATEGTDREIPATLRDALTARLDRLGPAREYAQCASVIGRVFPLWLLAAISKNDEATVELGLAPLIEAGLLRARRSGADRTYEFKHALVRDAAYDSMLRSNKALYHLAVAAALNSAGEEPGLTGRHYFEGESYANAVGLLKEAGERLGRTGSHREAVDQFELALKALHRLPDHERDESIELSLRVGLANSMRLSRGRDSAETHRATLSAMKLAEKASQPEQLFASTHALMFIEFSRGDFAAAFRLGGQALEHARRNGEFRHECVTLQNLSIFHKFLSNVDLATKHSDAAIDVYGRISDPSSVNFMLGGDLESRGLALSAAHALSAGFVERGRALHEQAVSVARSKNHPYALAFTLGNVAVSHLKARSWSQASEYAEESAEVARTHGFQDWVRNAETIMLVCGRQLGTLNSDRLKAYLSTAPAGRPTFLGHVLSGQAIALAELGSVDEANELLSWAIERVISHGGAGDLLLTQAEILDRARHSNRPDAPSMSDVIANYRAAYSALGSRGARLEQLVAGTGLARCLANSGERDQAHALLRPLVAGFTEGREVPAVGEAEELLRTLD
jgi:tetratricopeptide (TPR) repeat protein